jgi:hypothetical protein
VSEKNKKQEALERAQKYVSGNKLEKSEVKKLEDKGFSASQIQSVADSMKVGDKAQSYMDRSGGGTSKVYTVGGDARVKINSKGQAVAPSDGFADSFVYGIPSSAPGFSPLMPLGRKEVDRINKKVDKVGGSLIGGEGMALSRFITIKDPSVYNPTTFLEGSSSRADNGKQQLAVYTPIGKTKSKSGTGSSTGTGTGTGTGSSTGDGATSAYQRVQDYISGRTTSSQPPEMFPSGINPGRAVEGVSRYADRLGTYNANYSGWMQDRAEADRFQSGESLLQFANILPKAPDVLSAKDMIEMANLMNKKVEVG